MARRAVAAFTLVEVLVVVAITGVVVAIAAVNLFPNDVEVGRRESGRIALALERARDAAWFGGRPAAVSFDPARLSAWRYAGESWQPDPTHDERFSESLQVTGVWVDGQPVRADGRLVFLPDGLGVPFRVALQIRGLPWSVEGDPAGAVTVAER